MVSFIVCFKNNFISVCCFYDVAAAAPGVCEQSLGCGCPLVDGGVRTPTLQETLMMEFALFLNYFFGWLNAFSTEPSDKKKHLHHDADSLLECSDDSASERLQKSITLS